MAKVLGIIGGGQLGMMLAEAAKNERMVQEISDVIVLDPTSPQCPASHAGAKQIVADFKDRDAIVSLADRADIITYEIESGDSDVLESVRQYAEINPSPQTLRVIQDKFLQKSFLSDNGIKVPRFMMVHDVKDVVDGIRRFNSMGLLKARKGGYDGRGNFKIDSLEDVQKAYDYFNGELTMLEEFVPFEMEVSVIASRNTKGQIKTYPLVENVHQNNILRMSIVPARIKDEGVAKKAQEIAINVMSVLKGSGTFGIEMFVTRDGDVLVNEIAPRVHNSGHHTLQSCKTSQFEQHLRAILGLELGDTDLLYNTVMYNILGSSQFSGEYKISDALGDNATMEKNGVFLKMYGKRISKPLRKLGHVNLVGLHGESVKTLLERLEGLKAMVAVVPL